MNSLPSRRRALLRLGRGALAAGAVTVGGAVSNVLAQVQQLFTPTRPQTEGPYFKPSSPERWSLLDDGTVGTRLVISGRALGADGTPLGGTLLDFWQADDAGNYDNQGFSMRGHQYTDADGKYTLETVVPGLYPGRTRHIHVKVQAPNGPVLTTQLYFPNEPRNATDGIFDATLVLPIEQADSGQTATFDFVVATA
jgi:protocatechuate 3,4-dioxygenase beta subunit